MKMSVSLSSAELSKAVADIRAAGDSIKAEGRKAVNRTALAVQRKAKEAAPVNLGQLRSSIKINPVVGDDMALWVNAEANYSYWVEMGRGPGKRPPTDAIEQWVRRKFGLTDEREIRGVAYVIARAIGRKGTRKQPFLFPAAESERRAHTQRMKEALKTGANK